jgi:NAD(P)-dependent dehydrogenase (short-subunit alcohol dehydrogenase family)
MVGRLKDKVALVTGAGQGIGEAIARAFVAEGAEVVIAERNLETGQRVANEIGALFVACDVTFQPDIDRAVSAAEQTFGHIDILVNNAGANVFHRPLEMPRSEWARCMALDLEAAWAMAEAVLPGMRKRGAGAIINIASTHGFKIIPHTFPYPVAKHGLIGLTRSLGIEFAAQGIRVNAIAPGYIETEIARAYWAGFPDPEAERMRAMAIHPPGRIGRPEEVAMTAVFLASDEAPFINAETIVIDGGRSALYHD